MTAPVYKRHEGLECHYGPACPFAADPEPDERFVPVYCSRRKCYRVFDMEMKTCRSRFENGSHNESEWGAIRYAAYLRKQRIYR